MSFPNYHKESDRLAVLWERVVAFNDKWFPMWRNHNPVFYSNAMAGEVGEICSITKRLAGGGTNTKAHEGENRYYMLAEEAADVFIYSILLLQSNHTDLDEFFVHVWHKLDILEKRMAEK